MKKYSIGIDLGGTRIKIGLVADGLLLSKKIITADSAGGLAANLVNLETEINYLLQNNAISPGTFAGIGLAFPGLVDPAEKKILSTNQKYDDAPSIDMDAWAKLHWDAAFFIDNDARMAAVGEWKYGAGTGTDNLVVMTIGTGIGTSAIIEGKLLRGKHFQAGCLGGHFSIQYHGRQCNCGNIGCAEAYGSSWSLRERYADSPDRRDSLLSSVEPFDFFAVFEAAKKGDSLALRIREEYLDVWSTTVVSLIHAYDPEVVVLGGGVLNSEEEIIPHIKDRVKKHAWCPWGDVQVRPTRLSSDAGILGVTHSLQNKL